MLVRMEAGALWIALDILAAWRLTSLVCFEDGPFRLMARLRRLAYTLHLGTLIDCFHCAGLWTSALVSIALFRPTIELPFVVFAVSGGVSLLELAVAKRREDQLPEE